MDKFRQISTELWPLIDVRNWFSLSIFGISLPIFFNLCMKRSSEGLLLDAYHLIFFEKIQSYGPLFENMLKICILDLGPDNCI